MLITVLPKRFLIGSHPWQTVDPGGLFWACADPRRSQRRPAFYDQMMLECYRGGLQSPHIVQEGVNEPTILSLVSTGMGVGWVLATARW
jgi:hypothetical protein